MDLLANNKEFMDFLYENYTFQDIDDMDNIWFLQKSAPVEKTLYDIYEKWKSKNLKA